MWLSVTNCKKDFDFLLLYSSYIRNSSDRLFEHICFTVPDCIVLPLSCLSHLPSTPL